MIRGTALILLLTVHMAMANESPYLGTLEFAPLQKNGVTTAEIRPLSDEPKIANIKTNLVKIVKAVPFDGCTPVKRVDIVDDDSPVLMIMDGRVPKCGLMRMAQNARISGSRGVLLLTDNKQIVRSHCSSFEDSLFFSGIIDTPNFNRLPFNSSSSGSTPQEFEATLSISLMGSSKSEIEIWTSSLNLHSYEVMEWWNQTLKSIPQLQNKVVWRVRMALVGCIQKQGEVCEDEFISSCACSGEFCSPQMQKKTPQILVREDIRQHIILTHYKPKYFSYIFLFRERCLSSYIKQGFAEDCSISVMQEIDLHVYVINGMIDGLLEQCQIEKHPNIKLEEEMNKDRLAFRNYKMYPLILLNKETIDAKSQSDLKSALCRKLSLESSEGCLEIVQSATILSTVTSVLFYVSIVIALIAVGAAAVICFRNKLRKQLTKETRMQVETAVDNYFALTQQSSKKDANSNLTM